MQGTLVCVVILGLLQLRCALSFGGRDVSTGELEAVEQLRRELSGDEGLWNQWVSARATDLDLMRFLRYVKWDNIQVANVRHRAVDVEQSVTGLLLRLPTAAGPFMHCRRVCANNSPHVTTACD